MDGRQQAAPLLDRARSCVEQLQRLKQRAEKGLHNHRAISTQELLKGVEQDINDSLRNLKAWITEFEKGDQTDKPQIIATATKFFDHCHQRIVDALTALNSRLRHRRLWVIGFILHKRSGSVYLLYIP